MISSFVTKIRIYKFFDDFVLIYALYTLMFKSNGLNVTQISVLLATWSITSFLLEVPSGVIADKYNRRNILIFAQISRMCGFLIWLIFPTFWGFLFGFVLWGIKSAFTSGTLDAYIYDGLKIEDREKYYPKVLGSIKGLSFTAILLSSTIASTLFFLGYKIILILSIVSLLISVVALALNESEKTTESTQEIEYFRLLTQGISTTFKDNKLLVLVLINAILLGAMAIDEYFALYVSNTSIPIASVGYLFAVYSLIQAFASFFAHKFKIKNSLLPTLTIFGFVIIFIGFSSNYIGIILFMLLAFISSTGQVLSNTAIQENTKSQVRATVSSVSGFFWQKSWLSVYTFYSYS